MKDAPILIVRKELKVYSGRLVIERDAGSSVVKISTPHLLGEDLDAAIDGLVAMRDLIAREGG